MLSLNGHVHFHVCAVDGVFEEVPAQGQTDLRRRILRAFVGRGFLESCDAKDMLAYQHSELALTSVAPRSTSCTSSHWS